MTRVRLIDGVELKLDAPMTQVREALKAALSGGEPLDINLGDDRWIAINPSQVVYIEDTDDEEPPRPGHTGTEQVPTSANGAHRSARSVEPAAG